MGRICPESDRDNFIARAHIFSNRTGKIIWRAMGQLTEAKKAYREQGRLARERIGEPIRGGLTRMMEKAFLSSELFHQAEELLLYFPIFGEMNTKGLFAAARAAGKLTWYPRVEGKELVFYLIDDFSALSPSVMGIPEPVFTGEEAQRRRLDPAKLSHHAVGIIPGVAFTASGERLGRGAGFYDRFLASGAERLITVGLAFQAQIFEKLPIEEWDMPVDYLLTERGLHAAKRG